MGLLAELVLLNAGWKPVDVAGHQGWEPSPRLRDAMLRHLDRLVSVFPAMRKWTAAGLAERMDRFLPEPLSTERALAVETAVMAPVHAAERENFLRSKGWRESETPMGFGPPLRGWRHDEVDGGRLWACTDAAIIEEYGRAVQRWVERHTFDVEPEPTGEQYVWRAPPDDRVIMESPPCQARASKVAEPEVCRPGTLAAVVAMLSTMQGVGESCWQTVEVHAWPSNGPSPYVDVTIQTQCDASSAAWRRIAEAIHELVKNESPIGICVRLRMPEPGPSRSRETIRLTFEHA